MQSTDDDCDVGEPRLLARKLLNTVEFRAFAKINLGLHVLRKRDDGFHDIETVFFRVGWHDNLRFGPGSGINMSCSDPGLPVDGGNLCVRAAQILSEEEGSDGDGDGGVHIHLEKRIPYGAGLGGGSSDAAVTLLACNQIWGMSLPDRKLAQIAAGIGSDVAFFMGAGTAFGSGRGERLEPMEMPPALLGKFIVILAADTHVSTASAYAGVKPRSDGRAPLRELVSGGSLQDWSSRLENDFEESVFRQYPGIEMLKNTLYDCGAGYASMSGSGSAVYGIFDSSEEAASCCGQVSRSVRSWKGPAD